MIKILFMKIFFKNNFNFFLYMKFQCCSKYHHWIISNIKRTEIYEKKYNITFYYIIFALNSGFDDGLWWVLYYIECKKYFIADFIYKKIISKGLNNNGLMFWDRQKTVINSITNLLYIIC